MEQPKIKKVRPNEIRVTFTDNEEDLYKFVKSKKSISGYVKELIQNDMEKPNEQDTSLKVIEELVLKIVDLSKDIDVTRDKEQPKTAEISTYDNQVQYDNLNIKIEEDEF
ncbi:MAG: hypothetical protein ACRCVJ_19050 [Clostridium sp.]|uniref:hypothetical protein n=1 Tax=Clostridium sp. TaxID=1506 RepID=UPI003F356DE7